jgi:hypothetical protein
MVADFGLDCLAGGEDAQAGEAGMHDDKTHRLGVKRRWVLIGWWHWGLEGYFFELLPMLPLPEAGVDPCCVVWGRLPACSFCVLWPLFGFRCAVPLCC